MREPICSELFRPFLVKADKAFFATPIDRTVKDVAQYAKVTQSRRFVFDLIDRVETLGFSFLRLRELSTVYLDAGRHIESSKQSVEGRPGTFEVSDEWQGKQDRVVLEARSITAFLYYEISGLANLMEKIGLKFTGELLYAVKARNKFLEHPEPRRPLRSSARSLSVAEGRLLLTHAFNTAETDPIMFESYLGQQFSQGIFDQQESALKANREMLMQIERFDQLSTEQESRLNIFGIPEPDLEVIESELAEMLNTKVLVKIKRIAGQRIPVGR